MNVKLSDSLSIKPSIEQLPEPSFEPMNSPLSPTTAIAVVELLSEAKERKRKESEGQKLPVKLYQ
jgi:hypothetical protein